MVVKANVQIYVSQEARDLLKSVDTKKKECVLASELIINGINELKKVQ